MEINCKNWIKISYFVEKYIFWINIQIILKKLKEIIKYF